MKTVTEDARRAEWLALSQMPESMTVGELNAAVRVLRERLYEQSLRAQNSAAVEEVEEGLRWITYEGDPDMLPQDFFLAIVQSHDETGAACESAPVIISMMPTDGTLFYGDGTVCGFNDGDILRWAEFRTVAPSPAVVPNGSNITAETPAHLQAFVDYAGGRRLDKAVQKLDELRRVVIAGGLDPNGADVAWLDRFNGWLLELRSRRDNLPAVSAPSPDLSVVENEIAAGIGPTFDALTAYAQRRHVRRVLERHFGVRRSG